MDQDMIQARDDLVKFVASSPEGDAIIAIAFTAARQVYRHNVDRIVRDKPGAPPGIREVIEELKEQLRSKERFASLAGLDDQTFYTEVIETIVNRQLELATGVKI